MASQEVYGGKDGTASAVGSPGSQVKPEGADNCVYQPTDRPRVHQKRVLQALGALQILIGAVILALGSFLDCLVYLFRLFRNGSFTNFYTSYPFWGSVFFIMSGAFSVAAGRKPTKKRMQSSFGMNIASATVAVVGIVFLSKHLAIHSLSLKDRQSSRAPDSCVYLGASSEGLVSLMLILTSLELVINIFVSAMWSTAECAKGSEFRHLPTLWSEEYRLMENNQYSISNLQEVGASSKSSGGHELIKLSPSVSSTGHEKLGI